MSKHVLVGCLHSESRRLPAQSMRLTVTLPFFQDTMMLWGLMSRWLLPSLCSHAGSADVNTTSQSAASMHVLVITPPLGGLLTSSSDMPTHSRESDCNDFRSKSCQWLQVAASVSKQNLLHMWVNRGEILDHRLGINCFHCMHHVIDTQALHLWLVAHVVSQSASWKYKPVPEHVPGAWRNATPKPAKLTAGHRCASACAYSSAQHG